MTIPQSRRNLIAALKATGKPLVLVLMNGRPLALVKENSQADAILETWSPVPKAVTPCRRAVWRSQPVRQAADVLPRSVGRLPFTTAT
ncbi:glycoside hydrolase family 3 C-terminal domain-containing protein [Enterobacter hormaechei]